jgi:hypothetical protein
MQTLKWINAADEVSGIAETQVNTVEEFSK